MNTATADRELFDKVQVYIGINWIGYETNRPSSTSITVSNSDTGERVSVIQQDVQDFSFTYLTKQGITTEISFSGILTAQLLHSVIEGLFGSGI